jgi:peptidoglycan/xylan/chitin deacetylase (PgdA/CDA1 family)
MAASLPVLTFHALDDRPSVVSLSPRVFQRGMARLHESGYQTLNLLEAASCLQRRVPFEARSLVITFDDGYETVYTNGLSVLQRYGMSATVFLTVGETGTGRMAGRLPSLGDRPMLSWRQIREMQRWGIAFGSHTLTHADLTSLPVDRVKAEVCDSKAIIEDALSAPVACFAYPYGRHDRQSREIVRQHFACACSDKLGFVTEDSDRYALERVDAYYLRTDRLFDMMLSKSFPWYIWARSVPRRLRRAVQLSSGGG